MELIFIALIGAVAGLAAHALLPGRSSRGVLLLAALGLAAGALSWTVCLASGLGAANGWTWTIAVALGVIVPVAVGLALTPRRRTADRELRARLGLPA